jgi:hypothetical protein
MSYELWETPEYDRLIAERLGRGPGEFEGHENWDTSEEAAQAYARGVAEAERTSEQFWGHPLPAPPVTKQPREPTPPTTRRNRKSA